MLFLIKMAERLIITFNIQNRFLDEFKQFKRLISKDNEYLIYLKKKYQGKIPKNVKPSGNASPIIWLMQKYLDNNPEAQKEKQEQEERIKQYMERGTPESE